ncbi:GTP cyclohydrolase FolE2 [Pokkaliibacter sp. CJK22405]|uniref:GTP cyclohydrolase FolE2 n=1 Tax=Pokkaliibacter sp. CJK22405 TaxID=3384615 RepID=UPI003984F96B
MHSPQPLPDTARQPLNSAMPSLEWVGMESIFLPIRLNEIDGMRHSQAQVSIGVDLPGSRNGPKGIHMSRLYALAQEMATQPLTPVALDLLLARAIASHDECQSLLARSEWHFDFYLSRPALVTAERSGWQRYPVRILGEHNAHLGESQISLEVDLHYSSTCPCSAALSRQYLADAFLQAFAENASDTLTLARVYDWLQAHGSMATPHSQRSIATLQLPIAADAHHWGLPELITLAEDLLQTPVQTLVKRADEQAFAVRNGSQLMYVEDASRILLQGLQQAGFTQVSVKVQHQESLHAHDAVAFGSADLAR